MQRNKEEAHAPTKVIVIGAGGHGRVIGDIVTLSGDVLLGYIDDKDVSQLPSIKLLGNLDTAMSYKDKASFIVGIGNNQTRKEIMEKFDVAWYTAIHPSAVIGSEVIIEEGSAILANAVINTGSKLGKGVIINTAATVDHDNILEDYVHISPGAHLGGAVTIGSESWIGIGASVINNIDICEKCTIGAGAVVIRSLENKGVFVGLPAKQITKGGSDL